VAHGMEVTLTTLKVRELIPTRDTQVESRYFVASLVIKEKRTACHVYIDKKTKHGIITLKAKICTK